MFIMVYPYFSFGFPWITCIFFRDYLSSSTWQPYDELLLEEDDELEAEAPFFNILGWKKLAVWPKEYPLVN